MSIEENAQFHPPVQIRSTNEKYLLVDSSSWLSQEQQDHFGDDVILYLPQTLVLCSEDVIPHGWNKHLLLTMNSHLAWRAKFDEKRDRFFFLNLANRNEKGWKIPPLEASDVNPSWMSLGTVRALATKHSQCIRVPREVLARTVGNDSGLADTTTFSQRNVSVEQMPSIIPPNNPSIVSIDSNSEKYSTTQESLFKDQLLSRVLLQENSERGKIRCDEMSDFWAFITLPKKVIQLEEEELFSRERLVFLEASIASKTFVYELPTPLPTIQEKIYFADVLSFNSNNTRLLRFLTDDGRAFEKMFRGCWFLFLFELWTDIRSQFLSAKKKIESLTVSSQTIRSDDVHRVESFERLILSDFETSTREELYSFFRCELSNLKKRSGIIRSLELAKLSALVDIEMSERLQLARTQHIMWDALMSQRNTTLFDSIRFPKQNQKSILNSIVLASTTHEHPLPLEEQSRRQRVSEWRRSSRLLHHAHTERNISVGPISTNFRLNLSQKDTGCASWFPEVYNQTVLREKMRAHSLATKVYEDRKLLMLGKPLRNTINTATVRPHLRRLHVTGDVNQFPNTSHHSQIRTIKRHVATVGSVCGSKTPTATRTHTTTRRIETPDEEVVLSPIRSRSSSAQLFEEHSIIAEVNSEPELENTSPVRNDAIILTWDSNGSYGALPQTVNGVRFSVDATGVSHAGTHPIAVAMCAFGVSSGIFIFEVLFICEQDSLQGIDFVSAVGLTWRDFSVEKCPSAYLYCSDGSLATSVEHLRDQDRRYMFGDPIFCATTSHSRVTMILNLDERNVEVIVNGRSQGHAFDFVFETTESVEPLFPIVVLSKPGSEAWLVKPCV